MTSKSTKYQRITGQIVECTIKPKPGPFRLMELPPEHHLMVIDALREIDPFSLQCLRLSSRYWSNFVEVPGHGLLLRAEKMASAKIFKVWACQLCVKLRHETMFSDSILHFPNRPRSCAQCTHDVLNKPFDGKDYRSYRPGNRVEVNGVSVLWCVDCGQVKEDAVAGRDYEHASRCLPCLKEFQELYD